MVFTTSSHRLLFRAVAVACLVVVGLQAAGCRTATMMLDKEYYFVEPSIVSIGGSPPKCTPQDQTTATALKASDELVVIYSECIKRMLRTRMNLARIARLTSGTFAVLTAAAAAALGAVSTAPLTAITALAASSAVIPEFMRIFGADERARAYEKGVDFIEDAQWKYLEARTGLGPMTTYPQELTSDGVVLFGRVVASLKIVENLLVAQLPSIEDIQLASGRVAHIADVQVVLKHKVTPFDIAANAAVRTVLYTATATNVSASIAGPAFLAIRVKNAKGETTWAVKGTPTGIVCEKTSKQDLQCDFTSLAANGVVKVEVEATAPDAGTASQQMSFTGVVRHNTTKLSLSGAPSTVVVDVAKQ